MAGLPLALVSPYTGPLAGTSVSPPSFHHSVHPSRALAWPAPSPLQVGPAATPPQADACTQTQTQGPPGPVLSRTSTLSSLPVLPRDDDDDRSSAGGGSDRHARPPAHPPSSVQAAAPAPRSGSQASSLQSLPIVPRGDEPEDEDDDPPPPPPGLFFTRASTVNDLRIDLTCLPPSEPSTRQPTNTFSPGSPGDTPSSVGPNHTSSASRLPRSGSGAYPDIPRTITHGESEMFGDHSWRKGRPRQSPKAGSASLLAAVPRQRSAAPAWQPSFAALADIPRAVTTIEDGPSPKGSPRFWKDPSIAFSFGRQATRSSSALAADRPAVRQCRIQGTPKPGHVISVAGELDCMYEEEEQQYMW
eukprot:EG_transcript_17189